MRPPCMETEMNRFALPLVLVAAISAPTLVLAATNTDGAIKSIDAKAMTIMLDNNQSYHLPAPFKVSDLKVGEKVRVTWDKKGAVNEASAVVATK